MKQKVRWRIILLICSIFLILFGGLVFAKNAEGETIRLEKAEGTVHVKNAAGKDISVQQGMQLYSGYSISTDAKSYAYLSLDESKVVKTDEATEITVNKEGKKLEVAVIEGSMFFNVEEKLADDESMTIKANNISMSIRGTSGIVEHYNTIVNGEKVSERSNIWLLEGRVKAWVYSEDGTVTEEMTLWGGETVEVEVSKGNSAQMERKLIDVTRLPGYAAVEIQKDESLKEKIMEDSGIDSEWIEEHAEVLLAEGQRQNKERRELSGQKELEERKQAEETTTYRIEENAGGNDSDNNDSGQGNRPEPTETEATKEEITDPETSEPETTEPETKEPETTEPETSEPETSEPETMEPELNTVRIIVNDMQYISGVKQIVDETGEAFEIDDESAKMLGNWNLFIPYNAFEAVLTEIETDKYKISELKYIGTAEVSINVANDLYVMETAKVIINQKMTLDPARLNLEGTLEASELTLYGTPINIGKNGVLRADTITFVKSATNYPIITCSGLMEAEKVSVPNDVNLYFEYPADPADLGTFNFPIENKGHIMLNGGTTESERITYTFLKIINMESGYCYAMDPYVTIRVKDSYTSAPGTVGTEIYAESDVSFSTPLRGTELPGKIFEYQSDKNCWIMKGE